MSELQVAQALLEIGAMGFSPHAPVTFKSGMLSPVYVDNRRLISFPEQWHTIIENFGQLIERGKVKISYPGKHGIKRTVTVTDRRLVRIARRTQDLPGQHLFEFIDAEGEVRPVTSTDVNDYIKEATGEEFTAKDFRTWGASVIAFKEMARRGHTKRIRLKSVIAPVEITSKRGTTVVDADDQKQDLDVLLLHSGVSIGTENAAVSVSDADAAEILGVVSFVAADYLDLGGVAVAAKQGLNVALSSGSASTYVAVVSGGTGTYTASGITLRLGIIQD